MRIALRSLQGLPAQYWWLWSGTLINALGGFVVPFMAIYLTVQLGYSTAFAGLAVTLYGVGNMLACLVGGILTDRLGRRPALLGAQVLAAVSMTGLGLAVDPICIGVFAFLVGAGLNAARPARAAMMADLVAPADRVRAYTLNFWAINLGFAVAPAMAGALAGNGFLWLFLANALANLLCGLIVYYKLPETSPTTRSEARPRPRRESVLRDRFFLGFLVLTFLMAMVYQQYLVALPVQMTASGVPAAQYGLVMGLNGVAIVLLQLPIGKLTQRADPWVVLAVAALVAGVGFGLTTFASTALLYAATVVIWSVGEIANSPTSMAVVADLSPNSMRGRYQGVYNLAWGAASAVAPVLSGLAMQYAGTWLVWTACAVVGVLCAAGHLLLGRRRATAPPEPQPLPVPAVP
ncbi:MFS transporter [Kutzneria viridogrisea]|uniref:MFS family permease n=1 Tax=Kutzneria viridogrisea TaxID=47990 RepID=A0ABR6BKD8_9PSEU|nr:MFS family permease [Kutzneria viridogrisea]